MKRAETNPADRISYLPDAIIYRILSFVDTKTAVGTTAISRRWKNLVWISLSTLYFDDRTFRNLNKFRDFVKNVMKRRRKTLKLDEFVYISKRSTSNSKQDNKFVERLIDYAITDTLKHLQLTMPTSQFHWISGKLNLNSLTSLKLQAVCYDNGPSTTVIDRVLGCLPQLQILHLQGFEFDNTKLLSNCKNLVELSLDMTESVNVVDKLTIRAPKLVRLAMTFNSSQKEITLELPKLELFKFKSSCGIPFIRTEEFLHLKTAKVKFGKYVKSVKQEMLLDLLQKFCHAQHIMLSLPIFEFLYQTGGALENPLSPFVNLKTLTITTKEGNMSSNGKDPLRNISANVIKQVLNTIFLTSDVEHFIHLPRNIEYAYMLGFIEANRKRSTVKGPDRISDLPDAILSYILSFVDTKTAVGTTLISRRWKNLVWASLSNLHFDDSSFSKLHKFKDFVKNVLKRRDETLNLDEFVYISKRSTSTEIPTLKFVEGLLGYAVTDTLKHLQLSMRISSIYLIQGKLNLSSLTCLKLQAVSYNNDRTPAVDRVLGCMPNLQILHLQGFELNDTKILSNYKNLMDLSLDIKKSFNLVDKLTICAPKLVRLAIAFHSSQKEITLELPKLESIKLKSSCGIPVIFMEEFFHLKTAKVKFGEYVNSVKQEMLLDMLQKFCRARHLTLSLSTLEFLYQIGGALENPLSPFYSLKTLTITTKEGNMNIDGKNPLKSVSSNAIKQVLNTIFWNSDVEHIIRLPTTF